MRLLTGILACTLLFTSSVFAADTTSERISAFEKTLLGTQHPNWAPEKRMSGIEKQVFGKTKQGPLNQRLDAVSKLVDVKNTSALMPPEAPTKDTPAIHAPVNVGAMHASPTMEGHVVDEVKIDDATALLNKGIKLESEGKTQDAMDCFNQVISKDHYNANAFFNLGVVAEKHGDIQGALKNYRMAASIDPNDAEFRGAVAELQSRLTAQQPVFSAPSYMVPQTPVYQQPPFQQPVVSVPYRTPPVVGVREQPKKGHPYIRATAGVAAIGAAALIMSRGGGMGGLHCPICRMLGGL